MKKAPLYSRSRQTSKALELTSAAAAPLPTPALATRGSRLRAFAARHERRLWAVALLASAALMALQGSQPAGPPALTMKQIDAAMRTSIEETPLTSPATRAFETILPSVVRVLGLMTEGDDGSDSDEADDGKKH
ncbi:MAG: peptidase S1, partial [Burkholderiaceae bacterium]